MLAEKETDNGVIKTGSAKRAWFYFKTDIKRSHKLLQMVQRQVLVIPVPDGDTPRSVENTTDH